LRDQVLDWDDALPPDELRSAEKHSRETCLSLVLGSSLQITPSCDIPLLTVRKRKGKRGKLVIVNLQETPKDRMATMLVRAKTDVVMAGVMRRLGLTVPEYVRYDRVNVGLRLSSISDPERRTFAVRVGSSHGWANPVPWLEGVSFTICDGGGLENRPQSRFFRCSTRGRATR
jgi:mono-ADP-ribosyltransferase sirtuin 6